MTAKKNPLLLPKEKRPILKGHSLVSAVAEEAYVSTAVAGDVIRALCTVILRELKVGRAVSLPNIGLFYMKLTRVNTANLTSWAGNKLSKASGMSTRLYFSKSRALKDKRYE